MLSFFGAKINSDGSNTILSNIERTQMCLSIGDQSRTPYFLLCRMNIEPNWAFTRFSKPLIELTRMAFFPTSKELKCVHLLVIEL